MMPEETLTGSVSVNGGVESSGLAKDAAEGFGSSTRVPWVGVDGCVVVEVGEAEALRRSGVEWLGEEAPVFVVRVGAAAVAFCAGGAVALWGRLEVLTSPTRGRGFVGVGVLFSAAGAGAG